MDGGDTVLLMECQKLLEACDRRIAVEEEILELNDLSAKAYVFAHEGGRLLWQCWVDLKFFALFLAHGLNTIYLQVLTGALWWWRVSI